jgi:cation:H+ antiporter
MLPEFIIFILSFIVLSYAGSLLVRSLTRISELLGLSEYIVAFVLMSIATSIPEFFIGISSVIQKVPGLAMGNILGTNLLTLTLIIGTVAVASNGIKIDSKISRQNFFLVFFIAFLPILLGTDGIISRGDGILLLISFGIFIWRLLGEKEYFTKRIKEMNFSLASILGTFKNLRQFFIGIVLLVLSSFFIVESSKSIVENLNISFLFFGILFVALGTSLPELIFGIKAAFMKHSSMTLGNSLGSIAFNASFILGIIAVISPIKTDFGNDMFMVSFFLFISFLLFNIFSYSQANISRKEGIVLLLLYIVFLFFQIL